MDSLGRTLLFTEVVMEGGRSQTDSAKTKYDEQSRQEWKTGELLPVRRIHVFGLGCLLHRWA